MHGARAERANVAQRLRQFDGGVRADPLEMDRFTRVQELTRMLTESVGDVGTVQRGLQQALQSAEDQLAAQSRLTRDLQDDLLRARMVEFDTVSDRTPTLADLKPGGRYVAADLDRAGGTRLVAKRLLEVGKMDGTQLTPSGKSNAPSSCKRCRNSAYNRAMRRA